MLRSSIQHHPAFIPRWSSWGGPSQWTVRSHRWQLCGGDGICGYLEEIFVGASQNAVIEFGSCLDQEHLQSLSSIFMHIFIHSSSVVSLDITVGKVRTGYPHSHVHCRCGQVGAFNPNSRSRASVRVPVVSCGATDNFSPLMSSCHVVSAVDG